MDRTIMDRTAPPAIALKGVTHRYGEKKALADLQLLVQPGEIVGYLGPNGAGKSTTLKILTGQVRATQGEVRVLGLDPFEQGIELRRRLAYVPEVNPMYEVLSGREHLELVAALRGLDAPAASRRAFELLGSMQLEAAADRPLWTYSRGMRQRVAIASAFITPADLVLMDEPMFGLDVQTVILVKDLIRATAARGVAVLYSSHLIDVVEQLATRVVILRSGEVVADGSVALLKEKVADARLESLFRELTLDVPDPRRIEVLLAGVASGP